jgi:hypothetical protein
MKCENVKRLKGTKLEDLEHVLVTWMGQVNSKNGTATDEAVKEQVKVNWKADGCDRFCIQKSVCILLQKIL